MLKEDYIKKLDPNAMRRFVPGTVELRKAGDGKSMGRGYAAKFNTLSEDFGGFKERIAGGFFDEVLADDVRALFNHDPNLILGRSTKKTLRLGVDTTGLWYEYDDPGTTYSLDLLISLGRGDVDQSSFAFSVKEDRWDKIDNIWVRTLLKAQRLYDVSPVTYPAYPDTEASSRSLQTMLKRDLVDVIAHKRRSLELKIKSVA
jgi:uncharacterized protein